MSLQSRLRDHQLAQHHGYWAEPTPINQRLVYTAPARSAAVIVYLALAYAVILASVVLGLVVGAWLAS